ncbi:MAG: hypothetical protein ACX98W_21865, partial [bacterium]
MPRPALPDRSSCALRLRRWILTLVCALWTCISGPSFANEAPGAEPDPRDAGTAEVDQDADADADADA